MLIKQSYYKNKIPDLGEIKALDKELLELVGGIRYRYACKFLMLVKAYNNRNARYNIYPRDNKPYSFFTMQQAAEYIGVAVNTIRNIVKYLEDKGLLLVERGTNINRYNQVNFYYAKLPRAIEEIKEIKETETSPMEIVKVEEEIELFIPEEGKFEGEYFKHDPMLFYKNIAINGCKIEISDVKNVFEIDNLNPLMSIAKHNDSDLYFVGGVYRNRKTRCNDSDIVMKNYFALDIDIRKDIKEITGEVISDNQLYGYIDEILARLSLSDYGDYKYVIASGNGVHIYYIGDPIRINKDVYKNGVKRICRDIDFLLKDMGLKTDKATTNISSLFRCPLTINYGRERKYGMELSPCFIYEVNNVSGTTFNKLEAIGNQAISEREQMIEERKKLMEEAAKKRSSKMNGDNVFDNIKMIPAHEVFTMNTGIQLARDNKNFVSNKDGKYIGCFYSYDKNIIVNTGTHHLKSDEPCYSTFDYVMKEILGLSNSKESIKETINWFKNKYNV